MCEGDAMLVCTANYLTHPGSRSPDIDRVTEVARDAAAVGQLRDTRRLSVTWRDPGGVTPGRAVGSALLP